MNVRVSKSNRIATPVTVMVTPVNISEHNNTGRDFPSQLAEDDPTRLRLSPIEAGIIMCEIIECMVVAACWKLE